MTQRTSIEWTDVTWNPIRGCSRVSGGCRNCYAERAAARFSGPGMAYEGLATMGRTRTYRAGEVPPDWKPEPHWTGKIEVVEKLIEAPLRWKRKGLRVFVNSMSDLFHEGVDDATLDRIFAVMALTPHITYQVLTKRPERMREYLTTPMVGARIDGAAHDMGMPGGVWFNAKRNIWLGVSVEDQASADQRIPELLATPAAVRFISAEPLLGAIEMTPELFGLRGKGFVTSVARLHWVIVGGESGTGAGIRPMHPDWARSLRDQCVGAGVAFFFKQWGEHVECVTEVLTEPPWKAVYPKDDSIDLGERGYQCISAHDTEFARVGKKRAGRLLDGREWNEFPGAPLSRAQEQRICDAKAALDAL